ncbi:Flp pilus assembly protein CpaB [Citricoccus sp. SGAir0253]|uniref:Flp pilus assembly protein CpaB n=1 Tax=Citricoccus sp. SGAir0253 TaxID=2567881 RepID=UPI00143DE47D|nr:Flp pilus assembly protein CpaB [Citricoccus sp. SGAir0253]
MKKRIIGGLIAVLLAVVGTVLILQYVSAAESRAMGDAKATSVYVVTTAVPAGTTAQQLPEYVEATEYPAKAVPSDAVRSLTELEGRVSTVELQPGEQVLASRFATPEELEEKRKVPVPKGLQEISVALAPQRVVGGQLEAGDLVGVFVSLEGAKKSKDIPFSQLALHQVLVTQVQGLPAVEAETGAKADGQEPSANGSTDPDAPAVPEDAVIVTLALDTPDAERLVYAQEFGLTWLSHQTKDTTDDGSRPVTKEEVHE